jgi:WD40 repeat protein
VSSSDPALSLWSHDGSLTAATNLPAQPHGIAVSPDGRLLAAAGNYGTITLWDPTTLRPLGTLSNAAASIQSLAFSPDGQVLAAGATNGTITSWDVASRTLTATRTASQDTVRALAFAPDGTTLFSGANGRIIAWNLDPDAMVREDCQILSRDLGLGEAETLVPRFPHAQLWPSG